jgi:hypothetical protein
MMNQEDLGGGIVANPDKELTEKQKIIFFIILGGVSILMAVLTFILGTP